MYRIVLLFISVVIFIIPFPLQEFCKLLLVIYWHAQRIGMCFLINGAQSSLNLLYVFLCMVTCLCVYTWILVSSFFAPEEAFFDFNFYSHIFYVLLKDLFLCCLAISSTFVNPNGMTTNSFCPKHGKCGLPLQLYSRNCLLCSIYGIWNM